MLFEPAHVELFGGVSAHHEEVVLGGAAHGEVADEATALVQHGREGDAADGRHLVRHDGAEPFGSAGAGDFKLAVVGNLEQTDCVAGVGAFRRHIRVRVRTAPGEFLHGRLALGREPQRVFEAAVVAEHGVFRLQTLVHGCGAQRARGRQFFVREADAEAARVVFAHLHVGVGAVRPATVAGHVHGPHVGTRVAFGHPVGKREAHTTALAEASHDAASHPIVAHAAHRADERVAVRRESERAVHHSADAHFAETREVLEGHFQARGDTLEVVRQQVLAEVPRRVLRGPRYAGTLVGADEHAATLLAHVDLAFEVDDVELFFLVHELRQVLGDEVLVFHGEDGQLEAHHAADFTRPQAAGVHHVFGVHGALFGHHIPSAIGTLLGVQHAVVADNFGAANLRGLRIGVGDAVRVHVALDGIVDGAEEAGLFQHRIELLGLGHGQLLQVHA